MTEEFKCKLQCQGEILTRRSPSTKPPMMKNWPESTSHCHVGVHSLSQESFISSPTHFFVVQNDFNEIIFKNHFPPDFPFICHWLITQRLPTLCLSFLALSVLQGYVAPLFGDSTTKDTPHHRACVWTVEEVCHNEKKRAKQKSAASISSSTSTFHVKAP